MADKIDAARRNAFTPTPAQAAAFANPVVIPLPAAPTLADVTSAYPTAAALVAATHATAADAAARGQYARAAGAGAGAVIGTPLAAGFDAAANLGGGIVNGTSGLIGAIRDFGAGALGITAAPAAKGKAAAAAPVAVVAPATGPHAGQAGGLKLVAGGPVADALAQGRAADQPITPQTALASAITSILTRNPSINDVQTAGGLVPATVKQGQTARDMVFGSAYAQSKAIADQQVADLQSQVKAGTITQDQARAATAKVLATHFNQTAGLVGYDPTKFALADQLTGEAQ